MLFLYLKGIFAMLASVLRFITCVHELVDQLKIPASMDILHIGILGSSFILRNVSILAQA